MIQTPSKILTLEEFLKLPETTPASEDIDGKILQNQHQRLVNPDFWKHLALPEVWLLTRMAARSR